VDTFGDGSPTGWAGWVAYVVYGTERISSPARLHGMRPPWVRTLFEDMADDLEEEANARAPAPPPRR
jgi:hypothetical protein